MPRRNILGGRRDREQRRVTSRESIVWALTWCRDEFTFCRGVFPVMSIHCQLFQQVALACSFVSDLREFDPGVVSAEETIHMVPLYRPRWFQMKCCVTNAQMKVGGQVVEHWHMRLVGEALRWFVA